ncbi:tetratricopeptide repeat protein, partial [Candidatus Fermentibacterales bacterium]|nr:tetratricopeptide repeat protein [Candidatus Fermentibacterales bacterium]
DCSGIEAELGRSLGILETRAADVPERHRSIAAAFDYSWGLLNDLERTSLARLAVFRGGFDPADADAVARCGMATIQSLVDKSLLRRERSGRLAFHGLLRQLAEQRQDAILEEGMQGIRLSHARHFGAFLAGTNPCFHDHRLAEALDRTAERLENLRLGWSTTLEHGDLALAEVYAVGLTTYYQMRSLSSEAVDLLESGLVKLDAMSATGTAQPSRSWIGLRVMMLERLGVFRTVRSEYEAARDCFGSALDLAEASGSVQLRIRCLSGLGNLSQRIGDASEAAALYDSALSLARESDDLRAMAALLCNRASVQRDLNDPDGSEAMYAEALEKARRLGDGYVEAGVLNNLGSLAQARGNNELARSYAERGLELRRRIGDRLGISTSLTWLARIVASTDVGEAVRLLEESIDLAVELRDDYRRANALLVLSDVLLGHGETEQARLRLGEATAIAGRLGNPKLLKMCRDSALALDGDSRSQA